MQLLLVSLAAAQESPPAPTGEAPPRSGDLLRVLAESAGFEVVSGVDGLPRDAGAPSPPQAAPDGASDHQEMPPEAGSAPGFVLYLHGHGAGMVVEVAEVRFTPRDDGAGVDAHAGDGIGSAMIERYPGGKPLVVRDREGALLASRPIALTVTGDIPTMTLDLTAAP